MKVYVSSDHNGFKLREKVLEYLTERGTNFVDLGAKTLEPTDDWTYYARLGSLEVLGSDDPEPRGIFLCGSGQGMAIMANRHKGIRAAVALEPEIVRLARKDDDANVLSLPASVINPESEDWKRTIDAFLDTPFERTARYIRRNQELDEI